MQPTSSLRAGQWLAGMKKAAIAREIEAAGGVAKEFNTIAIDDGIAMGHQGMKSSLVSREVIADSIELTMRGHCYDAFVGIAGCDKSLPGVMMAQLRLNVPSVFMYGGSIMPGKFHGKDVTVVDVFEGVGMHSAGKMSDDDLHEIECVACPGAGACGGQFTANTMATAAGQVTAMAVAFLLAPLLIRAFGPLPFGAYTLVASIASFMLLFDLGLGQTTEKQLAELQIKLDVKP